ncbi:MAG: class I SAM-dependent methyltransferase [Candidatus Baltobacteraceae bacterium]
MNPTERFTDRASDYVLGRPAYPEECLNALFEGLGDPTAITVADLGAGTGISSRLLAASGARVIAVEPNVAMSEQGESAPNLKWQTATAEKTGLPSASADLVTAFQAFHWFDPKAAITEIIRILRPGGRAALVYNERDENDAFTAAYGALVRKYATDETELRRSNGRETFATDSVWRQVRGLELRNTQQLDRAGLHARAGSTSYLPKHGPAAAELQTAIDKLFDAHDVDGSITMHMKTIATIADL